MTDVISTMAAVSASCWQPRHVVGASGDVVFKSMMNIRPTWQQFVTFVFILVLAALA
jgi:hypothetical protein